MVYGPRVCSFSETKKRDIKKKLISSILLHGGGSSLFNLMTNFTIETIKFAEKI